MKNTIEANKKVSMDKSITDKTQNNSNELKWQTLASYFEREGLPVGESELSIEVTGIYSLPEEWLKLEACGSCDLWLWQTRLSEAIVSDGKFNQRELTDDEKRELENKKKPKTTGKKEEPSKEEKERILREEQERKDKEQKLKEHLESLSEKERIWFKKEVLKEEAWINFPNKNVGSVIKTGEKLLLLEEDINENEILLLEILKIPPVDEDPKKRPKPKGISIDEVKPVICCSPIDVSFFKNNPGETEMTVRTPLMLQETYEKILNSGEGDNKQEIIKDYVQKANTYAFLKINFSRAINPPIPDKNLPSASNILKREQNVYKPITADEICNDFRKQLKIAIEAICKEYVNFVGDTRNQMTKKEKGGVTGGNRDEKENSINKFLFNFNVSKKADLLKEKIKRFVVRIVREKFSKKENVKSVFKNEKDQFYSELFAYLCEELKLCMDDYVNNKKDELHEHIISSYEQSRKEVIMYANKITKESEDKRLIRLSKEYEIVEDYEKAIFYYKSSLTLIKNKDAWLSYAILNKSLNKIEETEEAIVSCMNEILNFKESLYSKENTNLGKSVQQSPLKELKLKNISQEMAIYLLYASVKFTKNRLDDAINFMNKIIMDVNIKNTGPLFNALLAIFYIEKDSNLLYEKHLKTFDRFILRENGLIPTVTSKKVFKQSLISQYVNEDKINLLRDEVVYNYIDNFFNHFNFFEISELMLKYYITHKHTNKYKLTLAKIKYYYRSFDEVVYYTNEILHFEKSGKTNNFNKLYLKTSQEEKEKEEREKEEKKAKHNSEKSGKKNVEPVEIKEVVDENHFPIDLSEVYMYRGHAFYKKNDLFNSAEDYVKAIRKKDIHFEFDIVMLYRLGMIFIRRLTWDDSKTVFMKILKMNPNYSFAWRFIGISLMRLKNFKSAEESLSEANLLDIDNSENWGFLTLYCLMDNKKYQAIECINELFKTNYLNVDILQEIAENFSNFKEYKISADIYSRILDHFPDNLKANINLADIYYNKFDKKDEAQELLERALEYNSVEHERQLINRFIDEINGKIRNDMDYHNQSNTSKINIDKNLELDDMDSFKENIDYDDNDDLEEFK